MMHGPWAYCEAKSEREGARYAGSAGNHDPSEQGAKTPAIRGSSGYRENLARLGGGTLEATVKAAGPLIYSSMGSLEGPNI